MPLGYKITLVACGVLVFGVLFYMVDRMGGDKNKPDSGIGAAAGGLNGGGKVADATGAGQPPSSTGVTPGTGASTPNSATSSTPGTVVPPLTGNTGNVGVGTGATPGTNATPGTGTLPPNTGATTGPATGTTTSPGATATSSPGTSTPPAASGNRVIDELLNDRVRLQQVSRTHTVGKGDTLSSISAKYYGKEKYWVAIAKMNPTINPDRLKLGQVVQMPDPDLIAAAEANGGRLNLDTIKPLAGPTGTPTAGQPANAGTGNNGAAGAGSGTTTSPKAAGATEGRRTTQAKPTGPAAAPRKWVRVEEGETLLSIAEREYSDRKYWRTIYEANRARLRGNPNIVPEGISIVIP